MNQSRTIILGSLTRQPVLYFPAGFLTCPPHFQAEFLPRGIRTLYLQFVDPHSRLRQKRYAVIRHHRSAWTSIPKAWLRWQSARPGDAIDVTWAPGTATLTFRRAGVPGAAHASPVAITGTNPSPETASTNAVPLGSRE